MSEINIALFSNPFLFEQLIFKHGAPRRFYMHSALATDRLFTIRR